MKNPYTVSPLHTSKLCSESMFVSLICSKSNKVSLCVQLTWRATYCCFYACLRTRWAWIWDTALPHSIKHTEAQPLVTDAHTWQRAPHTWTNWCDWTCGHTFAPLKVRMWGTYCIDRHCQEVLLNDKAFHCPCIWDWECNRTYDSTQFRFEMC